MDFLELAYEKPKVEPKKWMQGKHLELVTVDTLSRVIDECIESGLYACDLETTGLNRNTYSTKISHDRTKDSIVGICLSPDGHKGYYLPVRHKKGEEHNLPVTKVESEMRRLVASPAIAIFHNAKFDAEFLQFAGGDPIGLWDDPRKWEDTLILAYLRDTREKNKGLKALSKKELGFEMIELKELYPEDHKGGFDFSELDPSWEPVLWYAASDAICTYCLYQVLAPVILKGSPDRAKQDQVYLLEKLCLPATRWMERVGIPTNQDKVTELIRLGQEEFYSCLHDVYSFCETALGRDVAPGWFRVLEQKKDLANSDYNINLQIEDARLEAKRKLLDARDEKGHFIKVTVEKDGETKEWPEKYDILSRPQLGPLFEELEIPDLNRTEKSGQVQTTQGEIERLNEKHGTQYPFLPKIKRMGELQKALGTYLISLRRDVGPDGCIHPNYNQLGTDTGRYTTPSSKNPDQDGGTKFPIHGTPATYDKSRPECLLRIREAFTVRSPDHVMVAIDFGGVELRIATNYSREPKWVKEYFRCSSCNHQFDPGDGTSTPLPPPAYCPRCGSDKIGDLHSATAIAFYGEDKVGAKEFKQLRQQSKCVVGDTLVLTNKGLIPIRDLNPGAKEGEQKSLEGVRVWTDDGVRDATHFWNAGIQDTVRVETQGRFSLEGTKTHRVRVYDRELGYSWKPLGEISEGDYMVLDRGQNIHTGELASALLNPFYHDLVGQDENSPRVPITPDWAYYLGSVTGDGHCSSGAVTTSADIREEEWISFYESLLSRLGLKVKTTHRSSETSKNSAEIRVCSRRLSRELVKWGVKRHSTTATIPTIILQSPPDVQASFLAGLFDADGYVQRDGNAAYCSSSLELLRQTQTLLAALGVFGTLRVQHSNHPLTGKDYYVLCIGGHEASVFRDTIPVKMRRKFERFSEQGECRDKIPWPKDILEKASESLPSSLAGARYLEGLTYNAIDRHRETVNFPEDVLWLRDRGVRLVQVMSVKEGRAPVYDLTVPGPESFWANGFINHNSANFALAYGGGPHALMRATGCDENEAARHHRTFNQTYSVLKGWWDEIKGFARRHGYVPTAFGRQYPLPDIKLPISPKEEPDPLKRQMNKKFRSKAERNATNGPIQGFSADLTKLAMGLIYKEVKNRDWFDKVHLLITIHDELVFELHKSIAVEAIERFQEIMTRSPAILKLNWPVPLTTDCEVGFDWTVPYDVKDFRFRLVRRDGMQMDAESKQETGKVWPKELLDIFGPKYGYFDDEGSVVETTATHESTEPTAPTQSPARVDKVPASPVPRLVDGEPYEYRLRNWSLGTAEKLASVIVDCAGRGSHPLSIKSPTGEDALWPGARIMVNPIEFEATAKAHKL